jgi:hypothetical protein
MENRNGPERRPVVLGTAVLFGRRELQQTATA